MLPGGPVLGATYGPDGALVRGAPPQSVRSIEGLGKVLRVGPERESTVGSGVEIGPGGLHPLALNNG